MKLFSKVKNVNDIKTIFFDNYNSSKFAYLSDVVESGIKSLDNLDSEVVSELIKRCTSIDNYFGAGKDAITINDKLKTVLTTSMLLDKCRDKVKELNEQEFLTLAYFLTSEVPDLINNYVDLYNKEVLETLCIKFDQYIVRQDLLDVIDMKVSDMEFNNQEEIIKYINDIDKEKVDKVYLEMQQNIVSSHEGIRGALK
ncbi:MAG: hypothetical protein E7160_04900 [Firmicutes bacterium]|nr:hypothetical protein [Bacillota bacterium]